MAVAFFGTIYICCFTSMIVDKIVISVDKKFELMLTRRAKAYSSY